MIDAPKSDQPIAWPLASDPFLDEHLRGNGEATVRLRSAVFALNSTVNRELVTVLAIQGESGSGKNHLARVIAAHRYWLERGASMELSVTAPLSTYTDRFAEIELPNLTETLVESELFGHKKGAFTGADREKAGLFAGDVDDILLDEIGDASKTVQAKLLSVVETRRFRKVGAGLGELEQTHARLMLATHRDLKARVEDGEFREDLYWRMMEFPLRVPALREQPENIERLLAYQLRSLMPQGFFPVDNEIGLRTAPKLSSADIRWAVSYSWPGNLRQVRHSLTRWLAVEGRLPLRDVALSVGPFPTTALANDRASRKVGSISERLERARSGSAMLAPTLGDFVDEARRAVEDEIVAWYDDKRPTMGQLRSLFPEMMARSTVTKLSQWRRR